MFVMAEGAKESKEDEREKKVERAERLTMGCRAGNRSRTYTRGAVSMSGRPSSLLQANKSKIIIVKVEF